MSATRNSSSLPIFLKAGSLKKLQRLLINERVKRGSYLKVMSMMQNNEGEYIILLEVDIMNMNDIDQSVVGE